jgi:transposase
VNTKENKCSRRFDEEFKRNAVELLERGDRSLKRLGIELGVSTCSLLSWKKKYSQSADTASSSGTTATPVDLAAEVRRLQRELETVSRQRDILKKACSILGQEPLNGLR